jgi:3-oxoacyl-[acyl-carrier protein] reductase
VTTKPPEHPVAVVTGAARGIGAAIARRLASDGCDVAILDLDAQSCQATLSAVREQRRRAVAVAADVGDEASVRAAVAEVTDALGPPTVLVNNAGVQRDHMMSRMTVEEWDLVMGVNLRGAFLMSREAQQHMKAVGWGRIVNISSTAALGNLGQANYAAAKAGLQGFTKTLALELGRGGVTVNAVAPGFTVTDMTRGTAERIGVSFEQMREDVVSQIPVGRAGEPEDIAHAVAFFADRRSGFVSGQVLYVAGGPRG